MKTRWTYGIAATLLLVMALLMIKPALEDSAVVEETNHLITGYSYWKGYKFRMVPDHPPLSQMLPAVPLLAMDVKFSPTANAFLNGRLGPWWYSTWSGQLRSIREIVPPSCTGRFVAVPPIGDMAIEWSCPSSYPIENWFYFPGFECQMLGKVVVYGGLNDGDRMLLAGRLVQMGLTLLTGFLIFLWVQSATSNSTAGLLALSLWVFSPCALATGHIIDTDQGLALGMTAALFLFGRFWEGASPKRAALCGAATGLALVMKFTAITLAPIGLCLGVVCWKRLKSPIPHPWKMGGIFLGSAWLVIMTVYFPNWWPAPPPSEAQPALFGLPWWFQVLRPVLIPPDFFKGIALVLGHSASGDTAYLLGKTSHGGWWYYYPVVFFLKNPLAFVMLIILGGGMFLRHWKSARPLEFTPWLASGVYLAVAMTSNSCICVKQLLPIVPLLCVGIGCAVDRVTHIALRGAIIVLLAWQILITLLAYPQFIPFFSEAVGGARHGYLYSWSSDFDWGQDAKRLKRFLEEQGIKHIYLDYFGTQYSIEYLKIPNTRVTGESAHQIQEGYLVVSATQLLGPEWRWLRESRQPIARVANTLFVYQFP